MKEAMSGIIIENFPSDVASKQEVIKIFILFGIFKIKPDEKI